MHGGPLHGRELAISKELAVMQRFEFRVTSVGKDHSPIPREWQQIAIYVSRDGIHPSHRYFIGMADEE
jgi:hypothetical protein